MHNYLNNKACSGFVYWAKLIKVTRKPLHFRQISVKYE